MDQRTADAFRELMARFNEYRAKWIAAFGTDAGFGDWFTKQIGGK